MQLLKLLARFYLQEKPGRLDAYGIASRLSYFLWSSCPDHELLESAKDGSLVKDTELMRQARRMLQDPRSGRMAEQFACQWLHISDFDRGMLGSFGIVAAGPPVVLGAALQEKINNGSKNSVSFFGDGAIHNGAFHEAAGLAQLWNIPMLFVCENNGYAEATATDWHLNTDKLSDISKAYNMKSYQEDGNDVFKVYEITKQAIKESKEKSIPIFLELINYRFSGQYEGDTQLYQPKEEIEKAKENDPIKLALENCKKNGLEFSEVEKIKNDAIFEVDEAFKYAETQPWPDPEDALEEVYVNYPRESL